MIQFCQRKKRKEEFKLLFTGTREKDGGISGGVFLFLK